MPVFLELYTGDTEHEVLGYSSSMSDDVDVAEKYRQGLCKWDVHDAKTRSRGVAWVLVLLWELGKRNEAVELRTVGSRHSLPQFLEVIRRVLVNMTVAAEDLPQFLPKHLPGLQAARWKEMALQQARSCAEKCVAISDELQKPDTQFSGRILLGRIEAADGRADIAVRRYEAMLGSARDDEERSGPGCFTGYGNLARPRTLT